MSQATVESQDESETDGYSQESRDIFIGNKGEAFNATNTPKKLSQRIIETNSQGQSPAKKAKTVYECKECAQKFTNRLLWNLHKLSACTEVSKAKLGPSPIIEDFSDLGKYENQRVQVVCYVRSLKPLTPSRAEGCFRLRMTLVDKGGEAVNAHWTLNVNKARQTLQGTSKINGKKIQDNAMTLLYDALLRCVVINDVKVVKNKYERNGKWNFLFNEYSIITPLSKEDGDFVRVNPDPLVWGVPGRPFSAVHHGFNTLVSGNDYHFMIMVESISSNRKKVTRQWEVGSTVSYRCYGRAQLWDGYSDSDCSPIFTAVNFSLFIQFEPFQAAPWPTHTPAGLFNFPHVRNKLCMCLARYNDGTVDGFKKYAPSITISKTVEMVDTAKLKVITIY